MRRPNIDKLLSDFGRLENDFLGREFLAAKLRGVDVNVRIAGAICRLRTRPLGYDGFGVFRPTSHCDAKFVREATLAERSQYLSLMPRLRLIVDGRRATYWTGRTADLSDARFRVEGAVPIHFALDVQTFDVVHVRFDGVRFWFDELDVSRSPVTAVAMRDAIAAGVNPSDLKVAGVTPELRAAYAAVYRARWEPPPVAAFASEANSRSNAHCEADMVRDRLRSNLSHAGAELLDYAEHADGFRVMYKVDGKQHVSSINKSDLTVQSAGFCLDELDRDFDLASLVGVVREGHSNGLIYED